MHGATLKKKKGLFQNTCSLKRIWMKSMLDLNIMFKTPSDNLVLRYEGFKTSEHIATKLWN